MATMTVNCGSFNKTSYSGVTQYGVLVNFAIPVGAVISGCSVSFTTHGWGGQTVDRAFSLNGVRAHSSGSWAQAGGLNAALLHSGNNTFRVTLKGSISSYASWNIGNIVLTITYSDGGGGGGSAPPVGGGGPVSISPSSINAGAGSITVTCPAEAGIWHMVNWTFGTKSGQWSHYWETGGTGTINIPLSWIEEIPNAASGILAIRVRRSTTPAEPYSYATDQTTNVKIKVPSNIVPVISDFTASLVPNGVPEAIDGYVQGKSKVALAITATGGSYSPIASYEITGGGIAGSAATGTFGPFNMSGDVIFTAKVTDGRGRTATRQASIEIMPYSSPAFSSPEAWRSNYDGVKNQKGTYVHLKSGAEYSNLEGQNDVTLKGRVYLKGGEEPAWEDMALDTELILGGGALLYTRTYIAQIQVSDLIESRITEFIIPTKKTGFSIMAGMVGAAVGKSAETPGIFDVAWPVFSEGGYVSSSYITRLIGANANGLTADDAAIAAAVAATPMGGTLVFDARKTYLITLAISITKPMTIDLNGSTLKCDASSTSEIYAFVVASDNVTIKNGIVDMNMSFEGGVFSSGYNDLTFKDLTFKNLATTAGGYESTNPIPYHSSGNSIFIIGSDNTIIDRCNFFNCWNSDSPAITESNPFKGGGVVMWSSRHVWLTKLYFNHTGGGINLSKSSDFYIDNVHMYDIHDNGYYIQDDLYQVYSTNPETIHNIHLSNISIKGANEGIAFSVCRNYPENGKLANFKITNAHFENCDYAFYIRKGSGFQAENVSVVDCIQTMRVGGLYKYNSGAGPDYYRCTDISFDGLNVSNALKVSASGTGGAEIRVIRSDRIKILNSTQMGAYATTTDYHGIRLTYCDDCLMCNNRIIGPASGTVLTRGFSIDTCTGCTIMNPKVTGAATKVYTAGGSGNVIENWWA